LDFSFGASWRRVVVPEAAKSQRATATTLDCTELPAAVVPLEQAGGYQAHVIVRCLACILFGTLAAAPARADAPAYGPEIEDFDYAWPVQRFDLDSQRQKLHMSYLDVRPQRPNGRTIVLLHGKNFCAGTWETTIGALGEVGWRVIAPDQIGFCKSSKPERYQYSFQQLAANTHALLEHLGVARIALLGHSTGGMLAAGTRCSIRSKSSSWCSSTPSVWRIGRRSAHPGAASTSGTRVS